MAVLYAPTAQVRQLSEQSASTELYLDHVPYGFIRRVRWKSLVQFHADARFEVMPQQMIRLHEFVIQREDCTPDEVASIQSFFDAKKGSAIPFQFTAPDDGITYAVVFKEDGLEVTHVNAATRQMTITLAEVGDLDNSVNNGLVYPSYVESTTTSSTSSTTSTTTSTTVTTTSGTTSSSSTTTSSISGWRWTSEVVEDSGQSDVEIYIPESGFNSYPQTPGIYTVYAMDGDTVLEVMSCYACGVTWHEGQTRWFLLCTRTNPSVLPPGTFLGIPQ